jgi:uncharacterized protein YbjT (DUF2867 family)
MTDMERGVLVVGATGKTGRRIAERLRAAIAIAAFSDDGHIGQIYDVTGPRLITFAEAAAEIGAAIGPESREELIGRGSPADLADDLITPSPRSSTATTRTSARACRRRSTASRDFADVRAAAATGEGSSPSVPRRGRPSAGRWGGG